MCSTFVWAVMLYFNPGFSGVLIGGSDDIF
jgi:hypothetical protein